MMSMVCLCSIVGQTTVIGIHCSLLKLLHWLSFSTQQRKCALTDEECLDESRNVFKVQLHPVWLRKKEIQIREVWTDVKVIHPLFVFSLTLRAWTAPCGSSRPLDHWVSLPDCVAQKSRRPGLMLPSRSPWCQGMEWDLSWWPPSRRCSRYISQWWRWNH